MRRPAKSWEGQSDALARQAETARVQLIEGTLFEMLRLHHEIVASARYHDRQGRMVFLVLARSVREHTESYARNATVEDAMRQGLNEFREQLQSFLPTYLGNLQEMVDFVETSELSDEMKHRYMRLIRSQLSMPELVLIFFSATSIEWRVLKAMLEKYGFFYSIVPIDVGGEQALKLYNEDAYLWPIAPG